MLRLARTDESLPRTRTRPKDQYYDSGISLVFYLRCGSESKEIDFASDGE